ncbi:hypothetical protein I7I51_00865 [Histoplasma capsulatum]|uniref:Uncharacterized protein n=1 Tax=Ajellomyces capsulatus TaxID=5037 RepID=A0A8A1MD64_AJECA|nr:hypothetical protein I7I51_00865 [Histoplasma capsulatum]
MARSNTWGTTLDKASTEFNLSMWIGVRSTHNIRPPGQLVRGAPEIGPLIFGASGWTSKPEEQFRMEVGYVRAEPGDMTEPLSAIPNHVAKLLCSDMQLPGDGDVEAENIEDNGGD